MEDGGANFKAEPGLERPHSLAFFKQEHTGNGKPSVELRKKREADG